jgi:hypothetical protein
MSSLLRHRPSLWITHVTDMGYNSPRGPSAYYWVLATTNAAGTNGLTCLPKYDRFTLLNFRDRAPSTLTVGPSSSSSVNAINPIFKNTLFNLVMFTYTYERQDIIQIALKRLPGGGERRKKRFSDLALPLHVII